MDIGHRMVIYPLRTFQDKESGARPGMKHVARLPVHAEEKTPLGIATARNSVVDSKQICLDCCHRMCSLLQGGPA